MKYYSKLALFFLRISLGWLFLYAGVTKILDPEWSSVGYLKGATTFSALFQWFSSPQILPITDFVNEWGLTLLGASLILGVGVRLAAPLGALLMLLYYLPILEFPMVGTHSFIVDEHIVYALALLVLAGANAGRVIGLEGKIPFLNKWFR